MNQLVGSPANLTGSRFSSIIVIQFQGNYLTHDDVIKKMWKF